MFANEVRSNHGQSDDVFPFRLYWDAQQLVDAVPLRLHELFDFDAGREAAQASNAHRIAPPRATRVPSHYAGQGALPAMFRIR